jgi:hypothetical protein
MKKIIVKTANRKPSKKSGENSSKNNTDKYLICVGKNF